MSQEQAGNRLDERFRSLVTATSAVVYSTSPDWEMRYLVGRDFIADTPRRPVDGWTWDITAVPPRRYSAATERVRT